MLLNARKQKPVNTRFMNDMRMKIRMNKNENEEQREVGSVKEVKAGRPSLGRQARGSQNEISCM
jgi:hypothetical protein